MASSSLEVEILVHVAASSKASDDINYRRLAHSYLAFQPQTRTPVLSAAHEPEARQQASAPSEAFMIQSQDLSFESAIDNLSSPRLLRSARNQTASAPAPFVPKGQAALPEVPAWSTPPSQISDSYPLPDNTLLQTSPTSALEKLYGRSSRVKRPSPLKSSPVRQQETTGTRASPSPSRSGIDVPSSIPIPGSSPEDDEELRQMPQIKKPGVVPVTPLVPKAPVQEKRIVAEVEEAHFDVTHISSTDPSIVHGSSFDDFVELPPLKKRKTSEQIHSSLATKALSETAQSSPPLSSPGLEYLRTSLEIRSPSPPVSVDNVEPSALISAKLEKLAKDLSSRYRPQNLREVEPLERGYWLLDCSKWSSATRFETWAFLTNYIRSGLAGWGVWCRRDEDHGKLRMYCWGHVVKHMYLLLYLASGRFLKFTGAAWYGADGNIAVEVLPCDNT